MDEKTNVLLPYFWEENGVSSVEIKDNLSKKAIGKILENAIGKRFNISPSIDIDFINLKIIDGELMFSFSARGSLKKEDLKSLIKKGLEI